MIRNTSLATLLLLALALPARADLPSNFNWDDENVAKVAHDHPEQLDAASPAERARLVTILMDDKKSRVDALTVLERAPDLDRFETFRQLDRKDSTDVRAVYDALDANGQAKLLQLTQSAGAAGTAAGLQQTGIVSDNDDTAFPTQFTPDGPIQYKGAADFYKKVALGSDGTGDPSNVHYVSARIPALFPNSRMRLAAAGLPDGTFDGDKSVKRFVFGGLDGIQASKIENLDLWIKLHPGQRFVFLGDSLQRDPEVYEWVIKNHPEAVQLVLIHKAGGPPRSPADYKGEIFFDNYADALQTANDKGVIQPGAALAARPDIENLPLPDTDVSKLTAAEDTETTAEKIKEAAAENVGAAAKDTGSFFSRTWHSVTSGVSRVWDKIFSDKTESNPAEPLREGPRKGINQALDEGMGDGR
jgi:hypothetical protein